MVLPSDLSGVSLRFNGLPISVKSFGSLSFGLSGTGNLAAASASSPYVSVRLLAACVTLPFAALQLSASTCHCEAAAAISMARVAAPAPRSLSQNERIELELPVT